MSLSFNEDGQVTFYTGGYVMGEKPDIILKMILSINLKVPQKFSSPPPQTKL
jgi:hypothetical protein